MQRAAAVVEEQAQLAARLNVAAEMIDSIVMDNSVLDEAKRLTEAAAQKQQVRRQQQQRLQSPSPAPPATFTSQPAQPRSSRGRNSSVFWKPPPEAAQLCARNPSMDGPALSAAIVPMVRGLSNRGSDASQMQGSTPSRRSTAIII